MYLSFQCVLFFFFLLSFNPATDQPHASIYLPIILSIYS